MKKFFITTPIYYASGRPHIGNAYTSFIADMIARAKRLAWYDVKFATWLDENGQKMLEKAKSEWMEVMEFLDSIDSLSRQVRQDCQISYTDFIRTTELRHHEFVQNVMTNIYKKWKDFYKWNYNWLYCTGCEAFKKESDLIEKDWKKVCPDHLSEPTKISEENRFFSLSKYQDFIEQLYKSNPKFVVPDSRFNAIKAFVSEWLEDFSISRQNNNFWVKIPFDEESVVYIRFDALLNYMTVCQWEENNFRDENTQIVHTLGKDIAKFHAIYRPAMLESAWFRLPDREIVNGFFTVDGQKMSKTIGNVIYPDDLVKEYGRDPLVFYLFYDINIWSDWDFSRTRFEEMYSKMLIGGRWNLVNRATTLWMKYWITNWKYNEKFAKNWKTSSDKSFFEDNGLWKMFIDGFDVSSFESYFDNVNIKKYLEERYSLVQISNEFLQNMEPRKKYKEEETKSEAINSIEFVIRVIKWLSILSSPFLIESFVKVKQILWNVDLDKIKNNVWLNSSLVCNIFDSREFEVDLKPEIIYIPRQS